MSKLKIELKVGQIWGVPPVEKTLDVRVLTVIEPGWIEFICPFEFNIDETYVITNLEVKVEDREEFFDWKFKAVLIGHYDFKTGKAIAKK